VQYFYQNTSRNRLHVDSEKNVFFEFRSWCSLELSASILSTLMRAKSSTRFPAVTRLTVHCRRQSGNEWLNIFQILAKPSPGYHIFSPSRVGQLAPPCTRIPLALLIL